MYTADYKKADELNKLIKNEYIRSCIAHDHFNSSHEAYAVILEEVDELWDEVKRSKQSKDRIEHELIQIGAMVLKALISLNRS